jgi:NAD(P)-dependent dehydrogenase (short-subunit alcohol dehydrogenase family)
MPERLHDGKVAIVTGGGGGIGRAVAVELARNGASVVVNDVGTSLDGRGAASSEAASAVVAEITAAGGTAIAHGGSVTDPAVVGEIVQTAVDQLGSVDILVNVAGIMRKGTILDTPFEDWTSVTGVHLTGTFNTCRAAAPIMAERGWGRIINVTSHSAFGFEGIPAYAAAKAGIMGLTFAIATELASVGVTSNAIAPAASTRMSEASRADFAQMLADGIIDDAIWQRFLSLPAPEFTSPVVNYLASDAAHDITGLVFAAGFGVSAFKLAAETATSTKDPALGPFTFAELDAIIPAAARAAAEGEGLLGELPD